MKSVLLVDDNQIDTLINEKVLETLGLVKQFHKAVNGEQALQIIEHYKNGVPIVPDIILLDLNMPVMDGFEFIQKFQALEFQQKEKMLIIILTSSSSRSDMERANKLGIKYYLTKPLDPERVKSIIIDEFRRP